MTVWVSITLAGTRHLLARGGGRGGGGRGQGAVVGVDEVMKAVPDPLAQILHTGSLLTAMHDEFAVSTTVLIRDDTGQRPQAGRMQGLGPKPS